VVRTRQPVIRAFITGGSPLIRRPPRLRGGGATKTGPPGSIAEYSSGGRLHQLPAERWGLARSRHGGLRRRSLRPGDVVGSARERQQACSGPLPAPLSRLWAAGSPPALAQG
jgi:hypothetical protein